MVWCVRIKSKGGNKEVIVQGNKLLKKQFFKVGDGHAWNSENVYVGRLPDTAYTNL